MQQHGHVLGDNNNNNVMSAAVDPSESGFNRFQNRPACRGNYNGNGSYRGGNNSRTYHRHNGPYNGRPWINHNNYFRPRFVQPWVRLRPQQPYENVGLAFPPHQMPTNVPIFRPYEPRFDRDSGHASMLSELVIPNNSSLQTLPPRGSTLQAHEDDEEYCPEPVKPNRSFIHFRRFVGRNSSSGSTAYPDSSSSRSNTSVDDDYSTNEEGSSNSSLLLSPSPVLEKVPSLPDIGHQEEYPFLEVFLVASTKLVRTEKGQVELTASFGVWLDKEIEWSFADVLPKDRPQCLKAVLIFGSGTLINLMKERGHNRLKINMESDFILKNVQTWIKKFMMDACDGLELKNFANWDEYKYADEVKQLCLAFQGTVVKWSHVSSQLPGILAAKTLSRDLLKSLSTNSETSKEH